MLCVEDAIDALNWAEEIGGLNALIERSQASLSHIEDWINENVWVDFLSKNKEIISNTSITFKIVENWFLNFDDKKQRDVMKEIISLLANEKVAHDVNGYPKAPPSFRIWGGATVDPEDIKKLLPWINWAYKKVRNDYV